MSEKVLVFDTTLRDGEQAAGVCFSERDKIEIAGALEAMGVDVIEAGFPAASCAEARNVAVLLEETASAVKLAVDDDGKGFDTSADLSENGGLGMLFMRERAEAIGGDFRVTSLTGKGTTVVVTIGRDENGD